MNDISRYEIVYSTESIADLKEIYQYVFFVMLEPSNARNLIDEIDRSIHDLNTFPYRYPQELRSPWKEKGVRYFVVKNHYVYYFVDENKKTVFILRIYSCSQNSFTN